MYITIGWWYGGMCTFRGRLLYRYGNATLYSVRLACRTMSLFTSLNSFQSSSALSMSRCRGSNLGPPGMHMLSA